MFPFAYSVHITPVDNTVVLITLPLSLLVSLRLNSLSALILLFYKDETTLAILETPVYLDDT